MHRRLIRTPKPATPSTPEKFPDLHAELMHYARNTGNGHFALAAIELLLQQRGEDARAKEIATVREILPEFVRLAMNAIAETSKRPESKEPEAPKASEPLTAAQREQQARDQVDAAIARTVGAALIQKAAQLEVSAELGEEPVNPYARRGADGQGDAVLTQDKRDEARKQAAELRARAVAVLAKAPELAQHAEGFGA